MEETDPADTPRQGGGEPPIVDHPESEPNGGGQGAREEIVRMNEYFAGR